MDLFKAYYEEVKLVTNWHFEDTSFQIARKHLTRWFRPLEKITSQQKNTFILLDVHKMDISLLKLAMNPWDNFRLYMQGGRLKHFRKQADMLFDEVRITQGNRLKSNSRIEMPLYLYSKNWSLVDQQEEVAFSLRRMNAGLTLEMNGGRNNGFLSVMQNFLFEAIKIFSTGNPIFMA